MESLHAIKQLRKQGPGLHSLSSIPTSSASTLFPPPYRPLLPPRPLSLTHPRAQPRTSATSSHQQGWDVPVPSCPSRMLSPPEKRQSCRHTASAGSRGCRLSQALKLLFPIARCKTHLLF